MAFHAELGALTDELVTIITKCSPKVSCLHLRPNNQETGSGRALMKITVSTKALQIIA